MFELYWKSIDTPLLLLSKKKWVKEECMMNGNTSFKYLHIEGSRRLELADKLNPAMLLRVNFSNMLVLHEVLFLGLSLDVLNTYLRVETFLRVSLSPL